MAPDFDRLQAVNRELRALEDAGGVSRADWDRLYAEAKQAVAGRTQFLEGIIMRGLELGFVT
jgi:hypothetical protein